MPAGQHLPLRVNCTAQSHSLHCRQDCQHQHLALTSGGLPSLNDLGQVFGPSAPQFPGL